MTTICNFSLWYSFIQISLICVLLHIYWLYWNIKKRFPFSIFYKHLICNIKNTKHILKLSNTTSSNALWSQSEIIIFFACHLRILCVQCSLRVLCCMSFVCSLRILFACSFRVIWVFSAYSLRVIYVLFACSLRVLCLSFAYYVLFACVSQFAFLLY